VADAVAIVIAEVAGLDALKQRHRLSSAQVEAEKVFEQSLCARSQDSNPWQTQVMALGVPLLDHISLEPV
jgi:hypothetical protein